MLTLLRRTGLSLAAMSVLLTLAGCVVYPVGGVYVGHPHGYYYGGGGGGYYGHYHHH